MSLDQMRTFAEALAGLLRAGDLLILSGNLGAGKTTFTQSLGSALAVAGRITSPTFVIAREHPSLRDGPALVHVDAYRLSDAEELGDLDLDSELEESITVVEWGAGLAERLSSDYLGLTITPMFDTDGEPGTRSDDAHTDADPLEVIDETRGVLEDDVDNDDDVEDERRIIELSAHGSTWDERFPRLCETIRTLATADEDGELGDDAHNHDEEDRL
ncbi:MAG: tRNA (adenosine(37)-N6)-threonylcarbamoyltransferase complex ATPase subunit type 1 TsaE [Brevibacterium aurantiacum]|nr:tRNA (adenosine(37)-N6)-threonylcarbamoyltransferase complex ATPase subunit type 1 TsaE [Brevibacterium aurantiacum]